MVIEEITRQATANAPDRAATPPHRHVSYDADASDATPQSHQREPPPGSPTGKATQYTRPLPVPTPIVEVPRTRSGPRRLLVEDPEEAVSAPILAPAPAPAPAPALAVAPAVAPAAEVAAEEVESVVHGFAREVAAAEKQQAMSVPVGKQGSNGEKSVPVVDKIRGHLREQGLRQVTTRLALRLLLS